MNIPLPDLEQLVKAIAATQKREALEPENTNDTQGAEVLSRIIQDIARLHGEAKGMEQKVKGLKEVVPRIKEAVYKGFERDLLPRYLKVAKAIDSGLPVGTLASIGMGSKEIRYTQLLRFYLDPTMPHGLGDLVLKSVLGPEVEAGEATDWSKAIVHAEYGLGQIVYRGFERGCDIDLLIETNRGTIMIENKINSAEDSNHQVGVTQLERYSMAVEQNCGYLKRPLTKIFLTPSGKSALKAQEWTSLSYVDLDERLLETLPMVTGRNATVSLGCLIMDLLQGPLAYDLRSILAWKHGIHTIHRSHEGWVEFRSRNATRFKNEPFLLSTLEKINATTD